MRLILHIGKAKTGTTSLQSFLYSNRSHLEAQGFRLLDSAGSPNNVGLAVVFSTAGPSAASYWHRERGIRSEAEKRKFLQETRFMEEIIREIRASPAHCHTLILTSEQLWERLRGEEIEQFAQWCRINFTECQVVLYLRDQVELATSRWSMQVKAGNHLSLRRSVSKLLSISPSADSDRLKQWSQFFGKIPSVNIYRGSGAWDVRSHFAEKFMPKVEGLAFPPTSDNRSYGKVSIHIVRLVNALFLAWTWKAEGKQPYIKARARLRSRLLAFLRPVIELDKSRLRLSRKRASMVREHFREANSEMSRIYLNGDHLTAPPEPRNLEQR
ncbi:hypothetical protein IMCC13023_03640 [Candidatus Aquiluna sp. IMCC13023]|uniref:hypothetical protein n=1 Tax=Candidatus Aquiluna sp. IMCC13023 TaxID=1081644 RepID=UPI00025B20C9|nr:hypothetical protein [Candidatus Aquiluna sp. IMCC13023]EIC91885.1 hypothetical protein IMCC13023_03640 [Candidatus Aquiluna sp. IMCC13023]